MKRIFGRIVLLCLSLAVFSSAETPSQYTEKIIIVEVDIHNPSQASKAYTTAFDKQKVFLEIEFDDTLNWLQDFVLEEDPLEGPGCFVPDLKLIFRDYTYLISLYCTEVMKYKNGKPFKTSSQRTRNDLAITESVLHYLKKIKKEHFGKSWNAKAGKMVQTTKLEDDLHDIDDSILFEEDEEDDLDREMMEHAIDKDGVFDHHDDHLDIDVEHPEHDDDE